MTSPGNTTLQVNNAVLAEKVNHIQDQLDDANLSSIDSEISALKVKVDHLTWIIRGLAGGLGGLLLELSIRTLK